MTTRATRAAKYLHLAAALLAAGSLPCQSDSGKPQSPSLFTDPEDGAFDISAFLSSRVGFLPIFMPITEPAIGYGLAAGVAFLHEKPISRKGPPGEPDRLVMPTTTALFGAATENGTWAGGAGHLQLWDQGRIRSMTDAGYGSINLDWYGRDDRFDGHAIGYTNDVFFFNQRLLFQLGDNDFYAGAQYRLMATSAEFDTGLPAGDIRAFEFESQTSGLGLIAGYDSRDQPFMPRRGMRVELTVSQNAEWLGGDFDYTTVEGYCIVNAELSDRFVLGVRAETALTGDDAPFYDLPYLHLRGVPFGRYVDQASALVELELRWDLSKRWSLLAFGGDGRVASSYGGLGSADDHFAGGAGFRYLIAREYGIGLGVDVAVSDGEVTAYVGMGTGWPRP